MLADHLSEQSRIFCGMIAALALLPEKGVRLKLKDLKGLADEMPLWSIKLLEHVERVYIGPEGSPVWFQPP